MLNFTVSLLSLPEFNVLYFGNDLSLQEAYAAYRPIPVYVKIISFNCHSEGNYYPVIGIGSSFVSDGRNNAFPHPTNSAPPPVLRGSPWHVGTTINIERSGFIVPINININSRDDNAAADHFMNINDRNAYGQVSLRYDLNTGRITGAGIQTISTGAQGNTYGASGEDCNTTFKLESDPHATVAVNMQVNNDDGRNNLAQDFWIQVKGKNVKIEPPRGGGTIISSTTNEGRNFQASSEDRIVHIDPGNYEIKELQDGPMRVHGYSASYSPQCSGTMRAGNMMSCTITTDDIRRVNVPSQETPQELEGGGEGAGPIAPSYQIPSEPSIPGFDQPPEEGKNLTR
jgi:hypothetical protein